MGYYKGCALQLYDWVKKIWVPALIGGLSTVLSLIVVHGE